MKSLSGEQQDALFQALIRKIPFVSDVRQLHESTALALALMLRRPGDRALRDELTLQIETILAELNSGQSPERAENEMRFAARRCIKLLQAAKERRLPRGASGTDWAQAGERHARPAVSVHKGRKTSHKVAVTVALLLTIGLGYSLWREAWKDRGSPAYEGSESLLAAQMRQAAEGSVPAANAFGGTIRVEGAGGVTVVIAEGVPPRACVTAGWQLVRKGMITINGVTPARVSAAKITELCNMVEAGSTIMWVPEEPGRR